MGLMSANIPVSNPVKKIVVETSIDEVKKKMPYLCRNSEYYKGFNGDNAIMNEYQIKFKTPISGLVDVGMTATINLTSISDCKTQITIEVCDNFDAIDDSYQLKSAQMLIDEVSKGFGYVLTHSIEELENTKISENGNGIGMTIFKVIVWSVVAFIVLAIIAS